MDWSKCHQGVHRQGAMSDAEIEAAEKAGQVPGINPTLRAPVISQVADESEVNLHGDVEGSPYSANPGEISLADADKRSKEAGDAGADAAGTRAVEVEARLKGISTEAAAADADDAPKSGRSKK